MYDSPRLPRFALRPLRFRYCCPYQLPNPRSLQIRRLRDPDVPNQFALATQQAVRIGQHGAEVKAEVHPFCMRGSEDEGVAGSLREGEVVGYGVHLVDELAGLRSLFEDQFSRGQGEFLNRFAARQEEFEVLRIGWTQAHSDSVSHWRLGHPWGPNGDLVQRVPNQPAQLYLWETAAASPSPTRTNRCVIALWPNRLTRSTRTM